MNEQARLKKKLYELRFAMVELSLYLDTHPECQRALSLMKNYRMMYKETLDNYNQKYGKLIIKQRDSDSDTRWEWVNGPWPWENQANMEVK